MTYPEARKLRNIYLLTGSLAFVSGTTILLVTALKMAYGGVACRIAYHPGCLGDDSLLIGAVSWIYENGIVVSWLWPWMSETDLGGTHNLALSPSGILGVVLIGVFGLLIRNAARLTRWMAEVRELLTKEEMASSRRLQSSLQSIDVQAGRDSHITQQFTNHYNHRPDNPKTTIFAAVIGAIAVIAAALVRNS
jgi:hypothetical protein